MFVRDLYVKKEKVVTALKGQRVEEVLEIFKTTGYRCIPVTDEAGLYEGMIYKIHLKEYIYEQGGKVEDSIDAIIKHKDEYISEHATFIFALSKIEALPFISVLKGKELAGILTHSKVMSVFKDAFGLKTGGTNITISTVETTGVIQKLGNLLKNESIEGLLTLDNGSKLIRRIVLTLKGEKTEKEIDDLVRRIEKSGYRVLYIDQI